MKENDSNLGFQVTDRRFWALDEDLERDAPEPERKYPTFVEELKARTELAERKLAEKIESLDKENEAFRARFRKEAERQAEQREVDTFKDLLEVVDNLERVLEAAQHDVGVESLREGVALILAQFLAKLRAADIEPFDLVGQPFDPELAEAVGTASTDDPDKDQTVVEVLQKGYRRRDRLLRPARVRVGVYGDGTVGPQ